MSFSLSRKQRGAKEFDIVTLVDVVFLMLIFGLVVAAIEISGGGIPGQGTEPQTLHLTFKRLPAHPEHPDRIAVIAARLGIEKTAFFPPDELLISMFPQDWENEEAVRLIRDEIEEYHEECDARSNPIIVEASDDTPFRIVGFILRECSRYGDAFPKLRMAAVRDREVREL